MARRHAIAPAHRVADAVAATRAMTVLHATEPSTVHLSAHARADVTIADVERALYADRSLVKQLAMRRTLFVFPRDLLPAAWGSASARVAATEHRRLAKEIERQGLTDDGDAWLATAMAAIERLLADGADHSATEIRERVAEVEGRVSRSAGKSYASVGSIAPNVLTLLGAHARIVRGVNGGQWRTSRPRWTAMTTWLGEVPAPFDEADGYAELTRRWLRTFGPGTEADLVWWFGATKAAVRRSLADVGAVPVALESGSIGWVLPDDLAEEAPVAPWTALLPTLDPTTMGWRERDFYLDPAHVRHLFDSVGNGGTSAWVDGRMVGGWVQDENGVVRVVSIGRLSPAHRTLLDVEADRLTDLLDGAIITNVYKSHLMLGRSYP